MSNKQLARETIERGIRYLVLDPAAGHPEEAPGRIAQALEDSGLLAPDLPEPTEANNAYTKWDRDALAVATKDGLIVVSSNRPHVGMSSDEAVAFAHAVLAAAQLAEKQA